MTEEKIRKADEILKAIQNLKYAAMSADSLVKEFYPDLEGNVELDFLFDAMDKVDKSIGIDDDNINKTFGRMALLLNEFIPVPKDLLPQNSKYEERKSDLKAESENFRQNIKRSWGE